MKITITYCSEWNYLPNASSLEQEINQVYSADIELIAGSNGIFDIKVDGLEIFSKKNENRFPIPGEINKLINKLWAKILLRQHH